VGHPKFKIKAWATVLLTPAETLRVVKLHLGRFRIFRPVKRAKQRGGGPERPVHAAPPDVVETFHKTFFDVRIRSANHAVTI
jgi:hypothetical protein